MSNFLAHVRPFSEPRADLNPFRDEAVPPPAGLADYGLPDDGGACETAAPTSPVPMAFVPVTEWAGIEPPRREWLVRDRLPAGEVCLLQGDGAAGKTTIALQLLVATVRGTDWLGAVVERQGPALFLSAEEGQDEIHRRLDRIARHHGITLADLPDLYVRGIPGEDAVLGLAGKDGIVRPTPLFGRLKATAVEVKPALIALETAADLFAGNENDRSAVRQFIGLLKRLAIDSRATVLLLAHPSLSGMASGSGTSGSTGWNNSVRARLYFSGIKAKGEDEPELDLRQLRVMKSNYGPSGETMNLRWRDGVFVPDGAPASLEQIAAERDVDGAFLHCLAVCAAQGRDASSAPTSHAYAPKIFEGMPQASGARKRALHAAMERLLASGMIRVETVGSAARSKQRLVRAIAAAAE